MTDTDEMTQVEFGMPDRMRLFVSIQALIVYIDHDGHMELTRGGHMIAVRNIENWIGSPLPSNRKGQRLRRERIALVNALAIYEALGETAPQYWPTIPQVAAGIDGDFPLVQIDMATA